MLAITVWTITYTLTQYKKGHKHVLKTPLSQYEPEESSSGLNGKEDVDWYPANSFANSSSTAAPSNGYAFTAAGASNGYDYDTNSNNYYGGAAGPSSAYPFASGIGSSSNGHNLSVKQGDYGAGVSRSLSGSKYVQYEKENPFERLPPAPTPKSQRKALEKDAAAAW